MKSSKSQAASSQHEKLKEGGFMSIEAIVVVLFIVAGLALAAARMGMLTTGSEASEEISNIQTLFTNTHALKGSGGYGATGTNITPQLIATGGVPKSMSIVGGVLYNSFGGEVTVTSKGIGFSITSKSISETACNKAATKLSRGGSFISTKIGENPEIIGEVTAAVATKQCSPSGNVIVYTSAA